LKIFFFKKLAKTCKNPTPAWGGRGWTDVRLGSVERDRNGGGGYGPVRQYHPGQRGEGFLLPDSGTDSFSNSERGKALIRRGKMNCHLGDLSHPYGRGRNYLKNNGRIPQGRASFFQFTGTKAEENTRLGEQRQSGQESQG